MFLLPKMKSIYSIFAALDNMKYMFKNRIVLEISKKLIIAATNPLVGYLIVKVSYARSLLIIKLIFIGIEFDVF